VADALLSGQRQAILLGNAAAQHPQAGTLLALAQWIGTHTGASVGYLVEAANSVGAELVNALPGQGGLNAGQMLTQSMKALLLLDVEPVLDAADAAAARAAMNGAGLVVALTSFEDAMVDNADVLLPIAPFSETAGTFVNAEGRVLRVLGNLLGLAGFNQETSEEVRAEALGDAATVPSRLDNRTEAAITLAPPAGGLERIADVPIYSADALVRRAPALQHTADAAAPTVGVSAARAQQLGLSNGNNVRVAQGQASAVLPVRIEPALADNAVRVPAGHPLTAALGPMFGAISIEKA
jgi:NADH-quinone oxidoreductase subunit G